MKVVAFNGSPREGGNTEILLKKVLKPIEAEGIETKIIQVGGKNISGCKACNACRELLNKKCVFDNDIFNECFDEILKSEAILFGTPTYFAGMTPELKALIDRAGYVGRGNGGLLKHKIGAGVIAQRRGGATSVLESINYMFLMSEMIIPGSTYWNFGFGGSKGEVLEDKEALSNMKNLGENIVWLLKKIKA
jgi:multimeric flavodoxin WrbA